MNVNEDGNERISLTYGQLPEDLAQRCINIAGSKGTISFGNDERLGTDNVLPQTLEAEIRLAVKQWEDGATPEEIEAGLDGGEITDGTAADKAGDWASWVLSCLNVEWI